MRRLSEAVPRMSAGGCLLALLFVFIFLVVGVIAVGTSEVDDPTAITKVMTPFFFSLLIGVILGTRAFCGAPRPR